jgi:hypothetical protein
MKALRSLRSLAAAIHPRTYDVRPDLIQAHKSGRRFPGSKHYRDHLLAMSVGKRFIYWD